MRVDRRHCCSVGALLAVLGSAAIGAAPAMAQDQPADGAGEGAIIVTGTRLGRLEESELPVVLTTITASELASAAPGTLSDALKIQPMVVPGTGPAVGGGTSGAQNFLNLRGLGNDRTLVLVDGRRYLPSGPTGLVDINLIPEGLVSSVELITGGASSVYGSDAVSGVVNFKLDTRFEGFRAHSFAGTSQRGDNGEVKLAASAGLRALADRLSLVVSAEHYDNQGVPGYARDFRRRAGGQIRNPAGTPALVKADDVRTPYTPGGLVVVGAGGTAANNALVSGLMFNPGGSTSAYDYGAFSTTRLTANGTQDGGDGFRAATGQEVIRPLRRNAVFAHSEFAVSEQLTLEIEGNWATSRSSYENSPNVTTLTIQRANPFLVASTPGLVAQMASLAVPRFSLNRLVVERGPTLTDSRFEVVRGLAGLRLDALGLAWRASYQEGRNRARSRTGNNLISANMARAANAAISPATGLAVCADLLSADAAIRAAAAGCAPFNPFGFGAPSQAALDYVTGTSRFDTTTRLRVFDASVSGALSVLPAGPLKFAAGTEWRRQSAAVVADARGNAGAWRVSNQTDYSGRYSTREVFGEIQIPLLKDAPLARSLDVNLAARHTHYSNSGGVETWKAGLGWQIGDWLRLSGSRSRDIRAPSIEELFVQGRTGVNTISDALTGQTYNGVPIRNFGNPELTPEIADTWALGATVKVAAGIDFSLDYWTINIDGAIRTIGGAQTVEQCNLSGQTSPLCAFVTRDPVTRAITGVRISPVNFVGQKASGIDLEAKWRLGLGKDRELTLRVLGAYAIGNRVQSPLITNPVDDVGNLIAQGTVTGSSISSIPRLRVNAVANWRSPRWGAMLQGRYIHGFTWDKTKVLGVDTDFNRIAEQVYFDGELRLRPALASGKFELYLNVQNLLDHQPPYSPVPGNATPLGNQPVLYDQIGRMLRLGVRTEF